MRNLLKKKRSKNEMSTVSNNSGSQITMDATPESLSRKTFDSSKELDLRSVVDINWPQK